jgi:hypothetical protein
MITLLKSFWKLLLFGLIALNLNFAIADSLDKVCIQKEINDDNVIAEIKGGTYYLKKWSLRFSPLTFEGKCFLAKVSPMFVEIIFEDRDPIKWTIENTLSTQKDNQKGGLSQQSDCYETRILKPVPYLGNGGELIQMADGSIWQENSYQYLYLYEYNPTVYLCPSSGKMLLKSKKFTVSRIK